MQYHSLATMSNCQTHVSNARRKFTLHPVCTQRNRLRQLLLNSNHPLKAVPNVDSGENRYRWAFLVQYQQLFVALTPSSDFITAETERRRGSSQCLNFWSFTVDPDREAASSSIWMQFTGGQSICWDLGQLCLIQELRASAAGVLAAAEVSRPLGAPAGGYPGFL